MSDKSKQAGAEEVTCLDDRNLPNSKFALMEILNHALERLRNGAEPYQLREDMQSALSICEDVWKYWVKPVEPPSPEEGGV